MWDPLVAAISTLAPNIVATVAVLVTLLITKRSVQQNDQPIKKRMSKPTNFTIDYKWVVDDRVVNMVNTVNTVNTVETLVIDQHPKELTLHKLMEYVTEYGLNNYVFDRSAYNFKLVILTPFEKGDQYRTLFHWVNHPTKYQKDEKVCRSNSKAQTEYRSYGMWEVHFILKKIEK
jgi:hypothetical protein